MRIPPALLIALLAPGETYSLRRADYSPADSAMQYTDALSRAVRGEIEGIAKESGKLRCLRELSESERPLPPAPTEEHFSTSTAFAQARLGVYRQPVREVAVREDAHGHRYVGAAGDIVGYVYAHCGARA